MPKINQYCNSINTEFTTVLCNKDLSTWKWNILEDEKQTIIQCQKTVQNMFGTVGKGDDHVIQ